MFQCHECLGIVLPGDCYTLDGLNLQESLLAVCRAALLDDVAQLDFEDEPNFQHTGLLSSRFQCQIVVFFISHFFLIFKL